MQQRAAFLPPIFLLSLFSLWNGPSGCDGFTIDGNVTYQVMVVENGTVDEIILDCPYTLGDDDSEGLVIKWFYDDNLTPIFQWIPNGRINTPQLSDMDDVIDELYEHSEHPLYKYRALRLQHPDTSVSGLYTCMASSYHHEIRADIDLIIYALPKSVTLRVEELQPGNLSVQCLADPAFPEPHLELAVRGGGEWKPIDGLRDTTWSEGLFNTSVDVLVDSRGMQEDSIDFQCRFTFPLTDLSVTETLTFGDVTMVELPVTDHDLNETLLEDGDDSSSLMSGSGGGREDNGASRSVLDPAVLLLVVVIGTIAMHDNSVE